eukprot:CAMPEP_0198211960 /NCGR_PEP_ID=MMETSP1445-20131203/25441_1 /TAXON_ID=36898 /ORGANISM="Pyramimonas sp., Strain CCMP2087" /LENGTH=468 /DNA_ID=CAMNT_0043886321 /DNA_START=310 /DNA_END=1716 /DNA_ORIENTATION=-
MTDTFPATFNASAATPGNSRSSSQVGTLGKFPETRFPTFPKKSNSAVLSNLNNTYSRSPGISHSSPGLKKSSPADNFVAKYFQNGQLLERGKEKNAGDPWRPLKGVLIPAAFFHLVWWAYMIKFDLFYVFEEKYYMSFVMIFGSLIAGATSEGGGSVAFPVMTLAFDVDPVVARDVSFMIQSCGMSAATFTIFYMGVKVERNAFIFCALGGLFGIVLGLEQISTRMSSAQKKIGFVSIWFAFAFSLYWLNRNEARHVHLTVQNFPGKLYWRALVLILTGFIGGIFSSVAGSGLDIYTFATLTLLFRVSEKVATPTSVCLMSTNSIIGIGWRIFFQRSVDMESWEFIAVTMPVVVLGAPFGSVLGSYCHRLVLAAFVYSTDTVQLVAAYIIVNNQGNLDNKLIVTGGLCTVFGAIFFTAGSYLGLFILETTDLDRTDPDNPDGDNADMDRYWKMKNEKNLKMENNVLAV